MSHCWSILEHEELLNYWEKHAPFHSRQLFYPPLTEDRKGQETVCLVVGNIVDQHKNEVCHNLVCSKRGVSSDDLVPVISES